VAVAVAMHGGGSGKGGRSGGGDDFEGNQFHELSREDHDPSEELQEVDVDAGRNLSKRSLSNKSIRE
jgi:hypothetical protein